MSHQTTLIRTLVAEIENIRRKRRSMYVDIPHPQQKRFTQEELRSVAPVFKNLHIGNTQRLPSRTIILEIAHYLECTLAERNELLGIAEYLPDRVELREDEYQAVYEQACTLLHGLPLPAAVVSHGWFEEEVNTPYELLYPSCPTAVWRGREGAAIPWFFEHQNHTNMFQAPDQQTWQTNIRSIVNLFRYMHQNVQYESWYRALVREFYLLEGFREAWEQEDYEAIATLMGITTMRMPNSSIVFREQQVLMPMSVAVFPMLIVNVPLDEAAHYVYRTRGIATGENRWEYASRLSTQQ